jgi:hypothetical protein
MIYNSIKVTMGLQVEIYNKRKRSCIPSFNSSFVIFLFALFFEDNPTLVGKKLSANIL